MTHANPLKLTPSTIGLPPDPVAIRSKLQIGQPSDDTVDDAVTNLIDAIDHLQQFDLEQLAEQDPALARRLTLASRSVAHLAGEANAKRPREYSPPTTSKTTATLLDAITHALNVYGPPIQKRQIELVSHLDPGLADLPAGPIYTVLANGLSNAIRAIDHLDDAQPNRRIALRIYADAALVVIKLSDTGPGLCPELLDQFGQVKPGQRAWQGGHGIGLGVCRQTAQELGGDLTLANTNTDDPSQGATLTLRYPRDDNTEAA